MVVNTPYRRSLLLTFACASLLALAGSAALLAPIAANNQQVPVANTDTASLRPLSAADEAHYRQALLLQRAGKVKEAATELSQVANPLLKEVVQAQRATDRQPVTSMTSSGYERSQLQDARNWQMALAAFKQKHFAMAEHYFRQSEASAVTPEDKAAIAYWLYRTNKYMGRADKAGQYLEAAADQPPSFYSLLASTSLGVHGSSLDTAGGQPAAIPAYIMTLPQAKRAMALKQLGETALAEAALGELYTSLEKKERKSILALAKALDLPAMQMRIAGASGSHHRMFPVPSWEPKAGYRLERALLLAIMRQESGFNPNARSSSGAMGLMQLMPATLSAMGGQSKAASIAPEDNIAMGQRYLEHLMRLPQVGDNLIYLTAAYNAGPGNVALWRGKGGDMEDPLLFVETLPNAQTREYVQHVMANYWVYTELLSTEKPASLQALAAGDWPHYEGAEHQLVALLTRVD